MKISDLAFQQSRPKVTTTVSKFFTDKHGAAPPEDLEETSTSTTPNKRPSILQRLHIHSSGKRSKTVPNITIRPSTSSSLPPLSIPPIESRPPTSHSDAATVAEISQIMPQSLHITTPPSGAIKRQRSQEVSVDDPASVSANQGSSVGVTNEHADLANHVTARIPSYLTKSRAGQ